MLDHFHDDLVSLLPKLRTHALALCRNPAAADDLVQDAVVRALAARESFTEGTNFAAWVHRILRNSFLSGLRKRRDTIELDDAPASAFAHNGDAEDSLALGELWTAMGTLSPTQRQALVLVTVEGHSYEDVAEITGVAVGTAKCRVFRAREALQQALLGAPHEGARASAVRRRAASPTARPETRTTTRPAARSAHEESGNFLA